MNNAPDSPDRRNEPNATPRAPTTPPRWRTARPRCEFLENPIGIDLPRPRLSWVLESGRRGARQTAWQIIAATTPEKLGGDEGDLWDSGKVVSDRSVHIPYNGRALRAGERCHWKVRAWDEKDRVSAFCEPAFFEIGLLEGFDRSAQWIGHTPALPDETPPHPIEEARWIWIGDEERRAGDAARKAGDEERRAGDEAHESGEGKVGFRRCVDIPHTGSIRSARLWIAAGGAVDVWINGEWIDPPGEENRRWTGFNSIDIGPRLKAGPNVIAVAVGHTEKPDEGGLLAAVDLMLSGNAMLVVRSDRQWRAAAVRGTDWTDSGYDDAHWPEAVEKAAFGAGALDGLVTLDRPAPCAHLRREFTLAKPIARARLHATARGVYEMRLNGARVGAAHFAPGWTDYTKRIQYQTYDVTHMLTEGPNALGAILGDGWYAGAVGFFARRHHYGSYPLSVLAELQIDFADGSSVTITTDREWAASGGPILSSDFLAGEVYDARREMAGWDRARFDQSAWRPITVIEEPNAVLVAQRSPAVETILEIAPVGVAQPAPGEFVFDMGQNMVGWARLTVRGEAGDRVTLRFAEVVDDDGRVYTDNLRGAACTDTYILKGGGTEVFEPRFTYHGFRYVEVTGLRAEPGIDAITGIVIFSAMDRTGSFSCSSSMVNQLADNIVWSQRGNFVDVPTDCPQRDERLGWLGDAQIFAPTACFNMDTAAFFSKWMIDVVDAQSTEGAFPDVAPRLVAETDGAPAWGDAGVIVPWTCFLFYEDRDLVERLFGAMEKWIAYIAEANPDLIWKERTNNNYGDWVSIDADTPKEVLATAYFAQSTRLLSRMAAAIDRKDEAERYGALYERIAQAFREAFVDGDGRIEGDTQTGYTLALRFDLLPRGLRARAAQRLVDDIEARGWRISTGFVGVGHILPVLTRFGHIDVAYRLLLSEKFPSWGHCIGHGATTIWERWDGYTAEKGFQEPRMNSFNHYALGSVGAWLFGSVGGIGPDRETPGFGRVLIEPRPGGGLTHAAARYDSIRGTIECAWAEERDGLRINATIPANTTARVTIPSGKGERLLEGDLPAAEAEGVELLSHDEEAHIFEVSSGTFTFFSYTVPGSFRRP